MAAKSRRLALTAGLIQWSINCERRSRPVRRGAGAREAWTERINLASVIRLRLRRTDGITGCKRMETPHAERCTRKWTLRIGLLGTGSTYMSKYWGAPPSAKRYKK